jgi:hypothetical protein
MMGFVIGDSSAVAYYLDPLVSTQYTKARSNR